MTGEHHDKGAGPSVRNGTHSEEHLHNAQPSSSGPNGPPPLSFSFAQQGYKASPVAEFARHLPTPKLQRPPAFPPGTSHVGGGGNNPSPHVRSGGIPTQSPAPYMVQVPRATAFGAQKRRLTTVPQSPTPLSANPRNGLLGATPSRQLPQFGGPLSISLPFQDDMPIEHRPQRSRTAGPLSEENDAEMVEEAFQNDNPYPRRPKTSPPAHVDEAGNAPAGGELDSSNSNRGM
ncbi:uncharacterized protein EHS24_006261 [Apiotrichum porosum]|uniref:Uncharacterized protein n=1 Tax=Apiotrichum porosum TaxID=105984 RepID=A0A427Y0Y5_9TREE|nr:uncharacterized protein EHS24_006261 [Apiotrichum porosum]RSH84737.1 hypothetical protein EHS24_006261 [Apiotrichum porosum]